MKKCETGFFRFFHIFSNQKGFTLVELIIVIAIIAILAGAIFVAIDPARRLHESRNALRASDISTILDALKKYQADHSGSHYSALLGLNNGFYYQIGTATSGCSRSCDAFTTEAGCVNLSNLDDNYLGIIPNDPSVGTDTQTAYALKKEASGSLVVIACGPEGEGPGGSEAAPVISISR